jgi:hypothetical protein
MPSAAPTRARAPPTPPLAAHTAHITHIAAMHATIARARGRGARRGGARERGDVDVDASDVDERGRAVGVSWGEIR